MSEDAVIVLPDTRLMENKAELLLQRIANTKVRDDDSYKLMGELLFEVKKMGAAIEQQFEGPVKTAYQAHKSIKDLEKKVIGKFLEAEQLAKDKMANYDGPKIDGISKSDSWGGEVVNEALIPRDYLMPDLKKLLAVTKALKEETKIPGWKVISSKTLSVRT